MKRWAAHTPAYEYTIASLRAGKHVVTSNKEVVANYGDEFLREAEAHGVHYLFEASVGGGIPLIRPLTTSLSTETISSIDGIVNGTTNYILTKIAVGGGSSKKPSLKQSALVMLKQIQAQILMELTRSVKFAY